MSDSIKTENHVGYWKSRDYGDVAISEMSDHYLQKAFYRATGKIDHHQKELKKQQDLHQFWKEKTEELSEELKKRNISLETLLGEDLSTKMNIKGKKDNQQS